jgi:hypothetical protein
LFGDDTPAREEHARGGSRRDVRLMVSRQDTRSLVTSAFPGRESLVERAYRESGSFRDLCGDYRKCAAALERWRRSDGGASSSRAREYAELLNELAREIESWLDAIGDNSKLVGGKGAQ